MIGLDVIDGVENIIHHEVKEMHLTVIRLLSVLDEDATKNIYGLLVTNGNTSALHAEDWDSISQRSILKDI